MAVAIRVIEVSDQVRSKISGRHRLSELDVVEVCSSYELAAFDEDEERGRRLLVRGRLRSGRVVRVVLYPVDEAAGVWRLGTAF